METDLIGVWSADALFAPGAQEDEILVFRSDGTGWIEWINPVAHEVEFFEWTPTSLGWVVLATQNRFERDSRNLKRYMEVACIFDTHHAPYSIKEVETPLRSFIPQLELKIVGAMAGLYGLVQEDADSWPNPQTPT